MDLDKLVHMIPDTTYNPQQAHEYYLRTRKLKGRPVAAERSSTSSDRTRSTVRSVKKVDQTVKVTARQRQDAVSSRASAIQGRLNGLRSVLADLVSNLKAKNTEKPKPKAQVSKESSTTKSEDRKPLTPQQKAEGNKRSKDFYEKNKDKSPADMSKEELQTAIVKVRGQILKMKSDLAAASTKAKKQ